MSPACSAVCPGIGRTILWILLSSGLYSCLNHYHFVLQPKTWLEAQKYCREKFTDLASVDDMEEMKQLIAATGSGYTGSVWIGLYDKPDSWSWSIQDFNFYEAGEKDFRNWKLGQPNNLIGSEGLCVSVQRGFWYDYPCDEPKVFVCYNNTDPQGLSSTATERYFLSNETTKWSEASSYCDKHYTGLASVRNFKENDVIEKLAPFDQSVAIGLRRLSWIYWSDDDDDDDDDDHPFQNWANGHPSSMTKSCATSVMNAPYFGKWIEYSCNQKLHFMCQYDPINKFTVKLTALESTINLNDPVVTEAILNELQKKMKDKGFTEDLKISWIKKPGKDIFYKEKKANAVMTDL